MSKQTKEEEEGSKEFRVWHWRKGREKSHVSLFSLSLSPSLSLSDPQIVDNRSSNNRG